MSDQLAVFSRIFRDDKYVSIMINSVLNQDYKDFDFYILANDNTFNMIEKYAAKDKRIIVLRAVSPTDDLQNYYKDIASSHKYLFAVDGDDWLDLKCFSKMIAFARDNSLDIVVCGNNFCQNGKIIGQRCVSKAYLADKQTSLYDLKYNYQFFRTFWGKLWDCRLLKLIDEFPTSFEYGGYGGDTMECFCLLDKADFIGIIPEALYNYRCNSASVSNKLKKGRLKSDAALFKYVYNILECNNAQTSDNTLFLIQVYVSATIDSLNLIKKADLTPKEKSAAYQELFNNELFSELRDKGSIKGSVKDFLLIIFSNMNSREIDEYLSLPFLLCPQWKGKITSEIIQLILRSPELLSFFVSGEKELFSAGVIEYLSSIQKASDSSLLYSVIEFVKSNSDDPVLLSALKNTDFSIKHIQLISFIAKRNYNSACGYCREQLEKEDNYIYEIIEAYMNCAAINQDSDSFIHAKICMYYLKMSEGSVNEAQVLCNELLEMGLSEEDLRL